MIVLLLDDQRYMPSVLFEILHDDMVLLFDKIVMPLQLLSEITQSQIVLSGERSKMPQGKPQHDPLILQIWHLWILL